ERIQALAPIRLEPVARLDSEPLRPQRLVEARAPLGKPVARVELDSRPQGTPQLKPEPLRRNVGVGSVELWPRASLRTIPLTMAGVVLLIAMAGWWASRDSALRTADETAAPFPVVLPARPLVLSTRALSLPTAARLIDLPSTAEHSAHVESTAAS